jgi:adenylate cyclase class 2
MRYNTLAGNQALLKALSRNLPCAILDRMKSEIEVKARIEDKDGLVKRLAALGCALSKPISQDDTVFTKKVGKLDEFLSNEEFLRIRIQDDGKVILTAKKPADKNNKSKENLVKREYEVEVSSADDARGILEFLGFKEAVSVKKIRQTAHYGKYEICVDEIVGLGSFIELEEMGDSKQAAANQRDMFAFLMSLGVSPEAQVNKGYDILMIEKQKS